MRRAIVAAILLALLALPVRAAAQQNSILNLYDAFGTGRQGTTLDWGFSALVHYNGKTILFDSGNNADIFERNVRALGVNLKRIDFAVLSHRHNDHASGLDYLLKTNPNVKLYLPEDNALGAPYNWVLWHEPAEARKELPAEQLYFRGEKQSVLYQPGERFLHANREFVGSSREIAPGVYVIVTRSPLMGDFSKYPPHENDPQLSGLPELSLALVTSKGLVILTGCSHSRVEVIVAEAKKFLNKDVDLVMGGFHLLPYDADYIRNLVQRMKSELGVRRVAPAHCTGHLGFLIFRELYGENYSYAGLGAEVKFSN